MLKQSKSSVRSIEDIEKILTRISRKPVAETSTR